MNLATIKGLLDPNHPRYVTGTEEDRKQARDEWHRTRYVARVMASSLPEIPRSDIEPLQFGRVEDVRSGTFYRVRRDSLADLDWTNAVAYYTDPAGTPVLLEQPSSGPANRAELQAREAEREARRSAPKPRRTRAKR